MKKILFIIPYKSFKIMGGEIARNLKKENFNIHVLDYYDNRLSFYSEEKIIPLLKFIQDKLLRVVGSTIRVKIRILIYRFVLKIMKNDYDSVFIFYHDRFLNKLIKNISSKSKKLIIYYAGSDFYKATYKIREDNRSMLIKANIILFFHEYAKEDFLNYYPEYRYKAKLAPLGNKRVGLIYKLKQTENIIELKLKLNIPANKRVLCIGYNSSSFQNHILILKEIKKIPDTLKKKLYCILPMTYGRGDLEYITEVEEELNRCGVDYRVLKSFLSNEDIAKLRLVSDITVNMQTTDHASGSLLEHLCAGNILIVGDWLPYKFWDDLGIYYRKTNFENLQYILTDILNGFAQEKTTAVKNSAIIYNNFTWDKTIKKLKDILG